MRGANILDDMNITEVAAEITELTQEEFDELSELNDSTPFGYVDDDSAGSFGALDTLFNAMPFAFGAIVALFVLMAAATTFLLVRNFKSTKQSGAKYYSPQSDPGILPANAHLLARNKNLEQKLAELDDLFARRIITREEYAAARSKALLG
ncbi:hypothetical protein CQ017_11160 [Arthrobacter sp. MYb224]|nr:hypothetical protein CQ017_11160 [Arthrobacter sp. MYb224]